MTNFSLPSAQTGFAHISQDGAAKNSAGCHPSPAAESQGMTTVKIFKREAVPNCGSFEVCYSDGRDAAITI
jgi:hypothetical protein